MTRIAVIADSHFHPDGPPAQAAWASDAAFNARNAVVVAMLGRAEPSVVVHLGDVPHPVPGLPEHAESLAVARRTYEPLTAPLLVVPGNHDVGDKPHPWAPAPSVSVAKHAVFSATWGPPWWVVVHEGLRLVGIDTPVLNSGLDLEAEQWAWLAETLVPGTRTFVFLHYPPFLLDADEPEHYDNLAEPARSRLLALFAAGGVEAVFCGHVHHPFWNHHDGVDYYLLPSTAFVRPEYSELGRVGPGDEHGRNDVERLGFCLLHVDDSGHRVEWVHTRGATVPPAPAAGLGPGEAVPRCPLGLTLRHAWDTRLDLPVDGLEPFARKVARNDLVLLAALDLGVTLLRLPIDDLRREPTRRRLEVLGARGLRVVFFVAGPLADSDRELVSRHQGWIEAVEFVVPRALVDRPLPALSVPRWSAAFGRAATEQGRYFSHFAPYGFLLDDPDLARADGEAVVFRLEADQDPETGVRAASVAAAAVGRRAVVLIVLPRGGEAVTFTDDAAVADRVSRAFHAAHRTPGTQVVLDTTVDHDRGYFSRHGLLDRRGNPRLAFRVLWELSRVAPTVS